MPNKPRTQHRSIRIDDPEWDDGEAAADHMSTDRAKVINGLYRWWLRRPGATLPERPPADFMAEVVARRQAREKANDAGGD